MTGAGRPGAGSAASEAPASAAWAVAATGNAAAGALANSGAPADLEAVTGERATGGERTTGRAAAAEGLAEAWAVSAAVVDPEIPVLTIADLGVLRGVRRLDTGRVEVTITPTYSGCPALETIRADVVTALRAAGYPDVSVHTALSPAWTTDWMTAAGRRKLAEYGVAPPGRRPAGSASASGGSRAGAGGAPVPVTLSVRCPRCGSPDTSEISRFGSTACKALWRCGSCAEPFDSFKVL